MDAWANFFQNRLALRDPLLGEIAQAYREGMDPSRDTFFYVPDTTPNADRIRESLELVANHDIDVAALIQERNDLRQRVSDGDGWKRACEALEERDRILHAYMDRAMAGFTPTSTTAPPVPPAPAPATAPTATPVPPGAPHLTLVSTGFAQTDPAWEQVMETAAHEFGTRVTDADRRRLPVHPDQQTADRARFHFLKKRLWLESGKAGRSDDFALLASQFLSGAKSENEVIDAARARRTSATAPAATTTVVTPPAAAPANDRRARVMNEVRDRMIRGGFVPQADNQEAFNSLLENYVEQVLMTAPGSPEETNLLTEIERGFAGN